MLKLFGKRYIDDDGQTTSMENVQFRECLYCHGVRPVLSSTDHGLMMEESCE